MEFPTQSSPQDMGGLNIQGSSPFSTVAAPTAACDHPSAPEESRRFDTFSKFSELPTELRRKIWQMTVPDPQVVYVNYDVGTLGSMWRTPHCYSNGFSARGTWKIENGIMPGPFAIVQVCQEARAETYELLRQWEPIRLQQNFSQVCLFNFKTDTIFLGGSADTYGSDSEYVLPPKFPLEDDIQRRLRTLAISRQLWEDWEFEDDYGSDVTCERCSGYGEDESHERFKEEVYYCHIETFQVVTNGYEATFRYGPWRSSTAGKAPIRLLKQSEKLWYDDEDIAGIIEPFGRIDEECVVFEEVEI